MSYHTCTCCLSLRSTLVMRALVWHVLLRALVLRSWQPRLGGDWWSQNNYVLSPAMYVLSLRSTSGDACPGLVLRSTSGGACPGLVLRN